MTQQIIFSQKEQDNLTNTEVGTRNI
jgi:hypothetical protein